MQKFQTHPKPNYSNMMKTILLDQEEAWLREEGATHINDVFAYYERHYPDSQPDRTRRVVHELWRRLQIPKPPPDVLKCRLPLI